MKYFINGSDLEELYGIEISNSIPQFLAFPDRKASLQHDFPEEDGIDIDTDDPTFSARTFTFNCVQTADNIEALKTSYFSLFSLLKIKGTYSIYCDYVNMTIFGFYQKQANLTPPFLRQGKIAIRFDLTFGETDPFANIPNIFLVDDKNRFLVP